MGQDGQSRLAALAEGASDTEFYQSKLATGRYYMARQLPATKMHLARFKAAQRLLWICPPKPSRRQASTAVFPPGSTGWKAHRENRRRAPWR